MNGTILDSAVQTNSGVISGDDGGRYSFTGQDWQEPGAPTRGMRVDFDLDGSAAIAIHAEPDPASLVSSEVVATPQNAKSKIVAGLLAIFLDGLGIHKFCLGYHGAGILFLALWLVAFISACTIIGALVAIPLGMVIGIIALIEGIIFLAKFDEDFHQTYVVKQRMFF